MPEADKFESWAVVELFGHQRIAGLVSEFQLGGDSFVRVDVPDVPDSVRKVREWDSKTKDYAIIGKPIPGLPKFTKLYGPKAIYAIAFVSEATARTVAAQIRVLPIDTFNIEDMMASLAAQNRNALPEKVDTEDEG